MQAHCLEVTGDFACFTRPEMKVERVSYDVITPSAARAIFEAILWKPAIRWNVHRIEVLAPIRWIAMRRNEVGAVASIDVARDVMKRGHGSIGIDIEDERQQRAGLFLRDVAYRLHASFEITARAGAGDNAPKFADMFRRRAEAGQCFSQPYLGCREFACDFRYGAASARKPIPETRELGFMLYDLDFGDPSVPRARFFRGAMKDGVVEIPDRNSPEVRG